ncbi:MULTISPECIES: MFS transporter [unclassified Nocardia]|uniref:MFS transporter n=1 Tax=unclassified Nocardia TaxID=2637762 RepID=UPI001CE47AF8|nr:MULTISPECIES: MFS transporter [unclassified Nocardia]
MAVTWIAGAFTVLTFIGPVLGSAAGVHETALSGWLLIFGVAAVVGNTLGGRAADRYPAARLLPVSTAGLAVALAVLAIVCGTGGGSGFEVGAAVAAMAGWGIFGWSFAPIQQHRLIDLAPSATGIVLSLNASAVYLGISLGSLAGSFALNRIGPAGVAWTGTLIELVATVIAVAIALHPIRRPRRPAVASGAGRRHIRLGGPAQRRSSSARRSKVMRPVPGEPGSSAWSSGAQANTALYTPLAIDERSGQRRNRRHRLTRSRR